MDIYLIWAVPLLMGAVTLIAATPLFAGADDPDARSHPVHLAGIDGLRGYLALSVALHHGSIYFGYLTTGKWIAPTSHVFNQLGQASVGLFFIITGFLFWRKILKSGGVLDFPILLIGRVFRIGPVFLVLAISLMAFALVWNRPPEPVKLLTVEALQNLALGMLPVSSFNGVDLGHQLAGVTWTLTYEWRFYLLLPLLAALARPRNVTVPIVIGLLLASAIFSTLNHQSRDLAIITFFGSGLLCATLEDQGIALSIPRSLSSAIAVALLVWVLNYYSGSFEGPWPALLLGVVFYFILNGADIFGLLRLAASRRLGAISYDIYLCHGIILAVVFSIMPVRELALSSPGAYWLVLAGAVLLAIGLALLLHVVVERPGIALGKSLTTHLQPGRPQRAVGGFAPKVRLEVAAPELGGHISKSPGAENGAGALL